MTSEERDGATEVADDVDPESDPRQGSEPTDERDEAASGRRRDHPTFVSLAGFYAGLVYVLVVPAGATALLTAILGYRRATPLYPLVLLALVVPIALLVPERTRRFARYMLLGVLLTVAVVVGVGSLVLWILILTDG